MKKIRDFLPEDMCSCFIASIGDYVSDKLDALDFCLIEPSAERCIKNVTGDVIRIYEKWLDTETTAELEGVAVKDCITAKICQACNYVLCDVTDPEIPFYVASSWSYCPNCGTKIDWGDVE